MKRLSQKERALHTIEDLTQTMGSALVGMVFVEEGVVSQRMI